MPDSSPQTDENDPLEPCGRPEGRPQAPPPAVDPRSPLPARLAPLAEAARDYARAAASHNTNRAYAADWRHYCAWARRQNLAALRPDPQVLDGPQGPARRHRTGGHPPHPGPAARAEGGHPARAPPRHDRCARPRELTRPARPRDPARRLRRRPQALGNRRPRLPPGGWPQRRLDRIF